MPTMETKTLTLARTFDASPQELWAAWTDPDQYAQWLNPAGIDLVIHEFDVRPGGKVRFDMPQPDGNQNPQEGVFHEVDPPRRLVSGEADRSFMLEAEFEPVGPDRTRLVVTITGIPPEYREPATEGWNVCFDQLAAVVGRQRGELVLTRTFDASADAVWKAWTEAERFQEWFGPTGFIVPESTIDLRVGGRYLHCMRSPDGSEMWTTGTFEEVDAPHRLVMTHVLSDPDGNEIPHEGMDAPLVMTLVVDLAELDGGTTRMTFRHLGMPPGEAQKMAGQGWQSAFDKMAAMLA